MSETKNLQFWNLSNFLSPHAYSYTLAHRPAYAQAIKIVQAYSRIVGVRKGTDAGTAQFAQFYQHCMPNGISELSCIPTMP